MFSQIPEDRSAGIWVSKDARVGGGWNRGSGDVRGSGGSWDRGVESVYRDAYASHLRCRLMETLGLDRVADKFRRGVWTSPIEGEARAFVVCVFSSCASSV